MKIAGIGSWLITELAVFSIAIYAFKNPGAVGTFISSTATGIVGVTHAFEGRPS